MKPQSLCAANGRAYGRRTLSIHCASRCTPRLGLARIAFQRVAANVDLFSGRVVGFGRGWRKLSLPVHTQLRSSETHLYSALLERYPRQCLQLSHAADQCVVCNARQRSKWRKTSASSRIYALLLPSSCADALLSDVMSRRHQTLAKSWQACWSAATFLGAFSILISSLLRGDEPRLAIPGCQRSW